jgi:DNA-binding response OmpR family regulator
MTERRKVIAFDVDPDSLASLREAFPDWEIEATRGATARSIDRDWSPAPADLLVVGARDEVGETLGLCRGLKNQAGRAHTPLLVLVLREQEALVRGALDAGADSCLVLPVHAKEFVSRATRAEEDKRPGRHTLGRDQAQGENPWQDDGGEA